ncbi:MAG: response regulator transcription factor [Verrucomicrobiales bacterium]|nr:response regulator transcription factor [Verrucomicrobiales bacterium]
MNYLIVDDHPMTRQAVIESLRQRGDAFAEAGTGEEAIAYCEQHTPDWIIMDVKMPGKGGLFASRAITASRPEARIVVISQYADEQMAVEARAAGAIDFVSKDRIAELPEILTELTSTPPRPDRTH